MSAFSTPLNLEGAFRAKHALSSNYLKTRSGRPLCRRRQQPATIIAHSPDAFSPGLYEESVALLDVDMDSFTVQVVDGATDDESGARDTTFVDTERGIMALADYGRTQEPKILARCGKERELLNFLHRRLAHNVTLYSGDTKFDLRRTLITGLEWYAAPPTTSALLIQCTSNILRAAWVGACGFVVIRDGTVAYRSYSETPVRDVFETVLNTKNVTSPEEKAKSAVKREYLPAGGRRNGISATGDYLAATSIDRRSAGVNRDSLLTADDVQCDYFPLEENDLIIAGSDGLFANITEEQILAFVRPVKDPLDPTLALANATCLGSWTTDDVTFISYYLAHLAHNFATAEHSAPILPFPFPPSPHFDDVTALVASCSLARI